MINPLNVTSLKSRWIFLFPIKILKTLIGLWSKDRQHKARSTSIFAPETQKKGSPNRIEWQFFNVSGTGSGKTKISGRRGNCYQH